jgi:hypothetical protein
MKKITLALSAFLIAGVVTAQVKMPAPSPTQTIKQDFALGSIEVKYSRPAAKGRKVFGDLVPFKQVWRTGANGATLITFSSPVEIKGNKIDTGTYALYTIPGDENWEIILNKGVKNWGSDGYTESDDVARFKVESNKLDKKVESFTIQFAEVKPESCDLQIMWDKTVVTLPISANIRGTIRAQLNEAMKTDKKPYWQAAQYYNEFEKNNAKALEYVTGAVNETPNAFWIWLYKARIEKEMGNKTAAMASANKSLELAKEAKNNDYIKMNQDLLKSLK